MVLFKNRTWLAVALSAALALAFSAPVAYADQAEGALPGVDEQVDFGLEGEDGKPVPGADGPVSPTDASTHLDVTARDILSPEAYAEAAESLEQLSSPRARSPRSTVSFAQILLYAEQYLGMPYVWGAKNPSEGGLDCSGFACWVFNNVAGTGINAYYTNAYSLYHDYCTPVSADDALPGDLVFFDGTYGSPSKPCSHVGIYCGNNMMINAGDPIGYDDVREVKRMDGGASPYYFGRMKGVSFSGRTTRDLSVFAHVSVDNAFFTGDPVTPAVTVRVAGSALTPGVDYTVEYLDNTGVGTGTVVVRGTGTSSSGYYSSASATFDITDTYYDTPADAWYMRDGWIGYVTNAGLMSGMKSPVSNELTGYFEPEGELTRGQVATILYRYANPQSTDTTDPARYASSTGRFSDLPGTYYYNAAIEWCAKNGIVTGYRDPSSQKDTGLFGPDNSITRAELATMVHRFAKYMKADMSLTDPGAFDKMPDTDEIMSFAREAMRWCASEGIITGDIDNATGIAYARPFDDATRAQAAKIFTVLTRDVLS